MTGQNLVSITDAAKHLGINRSRLNQLINQKNLSKKKEGRVSLVNLHEVQNLVQQLAATGHIRSPKSSHQNKNQDNQLINHLNEEIKRLSSERNDLQEKIKAISCENLELRGQIKLLNADPYEEQTKEQYAKRKLSLIDKGKLISQILKR